MKTLSEWVDLLRSRAVNETEGRFYGDSAAEVVQQIQADARRAALEEAAKRLDAMLGEAWHDVAVAEASKDWEVDHHRERSKCFELARNTVLALLDAGKVAT
jgi:hypothetical protein